MPPNALLVAFAALALSFLLGSLGLAIGFRHASLNSTAECRRGFALPLLRCAFVFRLQAQVLPSALHRGAASPLHSEAPFGSAAPQDDAERPRRLAGGVGPRLPGGIKAAALCRDGVACLETGR